MKPDLISDFKNQQANYFQKADTAKYFWQTRHPFVSKTEKSLLPHVESKKVTSLLEIGCGEGGNLFLLDYRPPLTVGVDLFPDKIRFARTQMPEVQFVTADGQALPFGNETFDFVLVRDVLHHVEDARKIVDEAKRVLKLEGKLSLIETNGRNLINKLFAFLVPAERLSLRNRRSWIYSLLASGKEKLPEIHSEMRQPFPIPRILLHYRFGIAKLTNIPGITSFLLFLNRLAARLIPPQYWFYITIQYIKGKN